MRLVLLALMAFGFAQAGALVHAYAHDAALRTADLPPVHRSPEPPARAAHDACDACLAYAPLLSAAGTPLGIAPILTHEPVEAFDRPCHSHLDESLALAFRSRAPPAMA
jgi:hypothetical protein